MFGTDVAVIRRRCAGQYSFAVGVRGEDLGANPDQGLLDLLPTTPSRQLPR